MGRSKKKIEREGKPGARIWHTPSGEVVILGAPTMRLPEPKPKSYYGRRARFDMCTDCGKKHVEFGMLWCDDCRVNHRDRCSQEAEAGHRRTLMGDRTLTKPW